MARTTTTGESKPWYHNANILALVVVIVAIPAAVIGWYVMREPELSGERLAAELAKEGPVPEAVLGKSDAPVTIIEYSSLTCPHCARFHAEILPKLKEKYIDTGKAKYVLREFPLDDLAMAGFMLGRCLGGERYLPFVEVLYSRQRDWAFGEGDPRPRLFAMAKQAGFGQESFDKCLEDEELFKKLDQVRERAALKFKVNSTPTFFVNGQLVKGGTSVEQFEKAMPADVVSK